MWIVNYGYTFDSSGRVSGTQDRLRYSAFNLWQKSHQAYRDRYYHGKSLSTVETVFGREIHKLLEDPEEVAKHAFLGQVPRYEKSEYDIAAELEGVQVGGCLDSFSPETLQFLDYKSSHKSITGKLPWDAVKVARHTQLVFYSLLVQLKHGKVHPLTKLIWLETAFKDKTSEFDGHILVAQSRELHLTGRFEVFDRKIAEWERKRLSMDILRAAREISEDFKHHQNV